MDPNQPSDSGTNVKTCFFNKTYIRTTCTTCDLHASNVVPYLGDGTLMGARDLTAAVVGADVVSDDSLPLDRPFCCCPAPWLSTDSSGMGVWSLEKSITIGRRGATEVDGESRGEREKGVGGGKRGGGKREKERGGAET